MLLLVSFVVLLAAANAQMSFKNDLKSKFELKTDHGGVPCSCAVFLSGQFKKGSNEQPKGVPALIQETEISYPCNPTGNKMCVNKCLESIVKHLPNSPAIICGTVDRDLHRERAYLFTQNCDASVWTNSNLSAGREYCCRSGEAYSCLENLIL